MAMTKKKGPVSGGPKTGATKKKIVGGTVKKKNGVAW